MNPKKIFLETVTLKKLNIKAENFKSRNTPSLILNFGSLGMSAVAGVDFYMKVFLSTFEILARGNCPDNNCSLSNSSSNDH